MKVPDGGGEAAGHVGDEGCVRAVGLDGCDATAATREQLEGNATGARKEVEGLCVVPSDEVFEHVEEVLFRKVGGRSGGECRRDLEASSAVDSSDDSHVFVVGVTVRRPTVAARSSAR